jgi:outer membrane biosynthesis protein TonB
MRHVIAPLLSLVVTASSAVANPGPAPTDADALKRAEAAAIHHPHPDYPVEARRMRLTGRGIVVGVVDPKTGNSNH